MATKKPRKSPEKSVESFVHEEASRRYIPTAEYQSMMNQDDETPIQVAYQRRNRDLDPQLVWRGKDEQDRSDLEVQAPPLYIQEKIHPKVLIDDLKRQSKSGNDASNPQIDMFADFNGIPNDASKTEFYEHDANWTNRMILGDSLQVMASLAEREGLRGSVQCIYIDPPYGINFSSNWQWTTGSREVKDDLSYLTREPEQVKAFRDTWHDGIHSYLAYMRDRLIIARDLLTESGSIYIQIGEQNVHRLRSLLDEVFGDENFLSEIIYRTNSPLGEVFLPNTTDYILWYAKDKRRTKYRQPFLEKSVGEGSLFNYLEEAGGQRRPLTQAEKREPKLIASSAKPYFYNQLSSSGYTESCFFDFQFEGQTINSLRNSWKTNRQGMQRLIWANRIIRPGKLPYMVGYHEDFPVKALTGNWDDTRSEMDKVYVVQTQALVVQRCILMATDPGDIVLDPTCGSGTTAYISEQWGRRWITIDTSRVALALARARIMGSRFPYYLLADSRDGQLKEAEINRTAPTEVVTTGKIRQGFVYGRVPHITLRSITNNTEIDVIWGAYEGPLDSLRESLNQSLGTEWEEWEVPYEPYEKWGKAEIELHAQWWEQRTARQKKIDASISSKANFEYLYDKPYQDSSKIRVAGPFTVESISPHRVLGVDDEDELIHGNAEPAKGHGEEPDFVQMILENLKTSGVQQARKEDKLDFSSITPWPGHLVCAEGRFIEGDQETGKEKRAAIFVGPEFGTVSRPDLVAAAREAGDGGFDALITCAFNYDAHSTEFDKLGRIPVLKARMNADLHMADDLKNTGKGNLFVIFGEPDIDILDEGDGQMRVKINGVDVFHPQTGEVRSDGPDGIALWFVDSDYNEESFFVRQAYFLGANDPYKALKTTLKAEIDEEAWESLHSDTSRPFDKPESGRIAVKVINHLGDEVMKVFRVD